MQPIRDKIDIVWEIVRRDSGRIEPNQFHSGNRDIVWRGAFKPILSKFEKDISIFSIRNMIMNSK